MSKIKKILHNGISRTQSSYNSLKRFFHVPFLLGHEKLIEKEDGGPYINSQNSVTTSVSKYLAISENGFTRAQSSLVNWYRLIKLQWSMDDGTVENASGPLLKFASWTILCFIVFFGGWMAFSRIEGAVQAPGQIAFASFKQNVQSMASGTIRSILVKDGDTVLKGQTLIAIDDIDVKANYNTNKNQFYSLKLTKERLNAERESPGGVGNFLPSIYLVQEGLQNKELFDILTAQTRVFDANMNVLRINLQMVDEKKGQISQEIEGLQIQKLSSEKQLNYNNEELKSAQQLFKEGSIQKAKLLNLKSHNAQLVGQIGSLNSTISKASQQLIDLETQKMAIQNDKYQKIEDDLKQLSVAMSSEQEKLVQIRNMLDHTLIKAPQNGVVNNLKFHRAGEIIRQAEPIMEIVPNDDYLIVEAKLMTKDINPLLKGNMNIHNYNSQDVNNLFKAKINLSSYSNRRFSKLVGSVFYISADAQTDPRYGFSYYLIKIMISKKELEQAAKKDMRLFPGMPADAFILTEPRTPLSYFISPIMASFDKAFID